MDTLYELAGLDIERGYTGNLERRYLATGKFKAYRDAAHLNSADYAKKGGMYLTAGKHVCMVLTDGSKAGTSAPTGNTGGGGEHYDTEPPYVQIVMRGEHGVRVRKQPNTKAAKARENAKFGEKLSYIATEDAGWYRVKTPNGEGFISSKKQYTKLVT